MRLKGFTKYVSLLNNDFNIREEPKFDYRKFTDRKFLENREHLYRFVRIKGLLNKLDYAASGGYEVEIPPEDLPQK